MACSLSLWPALAALVTLAAGTDGTGHVEVVAPAAAKFPLFKQCGESWSQQLMGSSAVCSKCATKPATVCQQGCAMSCVSMALAGKNVSISGQPANPGTLNAWIRSNGGYLCLADDCNNLNLALPDKLSTPAVNVSFVSEHEKPSLNDLQVWVAKGRVCIAHVRDKTHFVLLTGWRSGTSLFTVNDPGFSQLEYDYADISDLLLYDIGAGTRLGADPGASLFTATGHLAEARRYGGHGHLR